MCAGDVAAPARVASTSIAVEVPSAGGTPLANGPPMTKRLLGAAGLLLCAAPLRAQTIDDGILLSKKTLCAGVVYGHNSWTEYWEGTLKRENGNVGTVTTSTVAGMATYGLTGRLNVLATLPFVSTHASGGTLQGQDGLQDLTLAAKFQAFSVAGDRLRGYVVGTYAVPVSDYVPDLFPLSLGMASQRLSGRGTLSLRAGKGWFAGATAAYTWRDNVTLDRPAYFTDGQLFLTDQVQMPNTFQYAVNVGYGRGRLSVPVTYTQQDTLGGGDIRRQDAPFISNRMNFKVLDALVMYHLPKLDGLALRAQAAYVIDGRNVGQSTTVLAGLMYTVHF